MKPDKYKIEVGSAYQYEEGIVEIMKIDGFTADMNVRIALVNGIATFEVWSIRLFKYLIKNTDIFTPCKNTGALNLYGIYRDTPGVSWFVAPEPEKIAATSEKHAISVYWGHVSEDKRSPIEIRFMRNLK